MVGWGGGECTGMRQPVSTYARTAYAAGMRQITRAWLLVPRGALTLPDALSMAITSPAVTCSEV